MFVTRNYKEEKVVESYTISGVTNADMHKMTQMHKQVTSIIANHLDKKAEKKEYLSDDDLYDIAAVLDVLTENNRVCTIKSVFEERKEELLKMHKELVEAPVGEQNIEDAPFDEDE